MPLIGIPGLSNPGTITPYTLYALEHSNHNVCIARSTKSKAPPTLLYVIDRTTGARERYINSNHLRTGLRNAILAQNLELSLRYLLLYAWWAKLSVSSDVTTHDDMDWLFMFLPSVAANSCACNPAGFMFAYKLWVRHVQLQSVEYMAVAQVVQHLCKGGTNYRSTWVTARYTLPTSSKDPISAIQSMLHNDDPEGVKYIQFADKRTIKLYLDLMANYIDKYVLCKQCHDYLDSLIRFGQNQHLVKLDASNHYDMQRISTYCRSIYLACLTIDYQHDQLTSLIVHDDMCLDKSTMTAVTQEYTAIFGAIERGLAIDHRTDPMCKPVNLIAVSSQDQDWCAAYYTTKVIKIVANAVATKSIHHQPMRRGGRDLLARMPSLQGLHLYITDDTQQTPMLDNYTMPALGGVDVVPPHPFYPRLIFATYVSMLSRDYIHVIGKTTHSTAAIEARFIYNCQTCLHTLQLANQCTIGVTRIDITLLNWLAGLPNCRDAVSTITNSTDYWAVKWYGPGQHYTITDATNLNRHQLVDLLLCRWLMQVESQAGDFVVGVDGTVYPVLYRRKIDTPPEFLAYIDHFVSPTVWNMIYDTLASNISHWNLRIPQYVQALLNANVPVLAQYNGNILALPQHQRAHVAYVIP